ncbi:MAG: SDR family oxidoreductase, partial [Deltaproteobacteria bacterium]|nr:SDR family oxidoreductase [Deltaproteobacteria bacterium]
MNREDPPVALVTGCSTGIGRALAVELHGRGYRVFATARRVEAIADLAAAGLRTLPLDVTSAASVAAAVQALRDDGGRLDLLVNNAGVNAFGPLAELPLERVRALLDTNVVGLLAMTQAVFPLMAARRRGVVLNVGSVVGVLPTPFAGAYCASKAAVHMLSEVLRMEVAPFGIDVVVVQPGGVRSAIADSAAPEIERYREPTSRYHAAYDGIRKRAFASQDGPMPAEDFARELITAVESEP